jgi:hypothetical protein
MQAIRGHAEEQTTGPRGTGAYLFRLLTMYRESDEKAMNAPLAPSLNLWPFVCLQAISQWRATTTTTPRILYARRGGVGSAASCRERQHDAVEPRQPQSPVMVAVCTHLNTIRKLDSSTPQYL